MQESIPLHSYRNFQPSPFSHLKVGYHTESRCQHQPASFSSVFKLRADCLSYGLRWEVGGSSPYWGHVIKEITTSFHRPLLLLYHFTPLQLLLTSCNKLQIFAPHGAIEANLTPIVGEYVPCAKILGHQDILTMHLNSLVPYQGWCRKWWYGWELECRSRGWLTRTQVGTGGTTNVLCDTIYFFINNVV